MPDEEVAPAAAQPEPVPAPPRKTKASQIPALSSRDVISTLERCGFYKDNQTGSHVKMVKVLPDGKHPVMVPHPYPRLTFGTLKSILAKAEMAGITLDYFLSKLK